MSKETTTIPSWQKDSTIYYTAVAVSGVVIGLILWIVFGDESSGMLRKLHGGLITFFLMIGLFLIVARRTLVSILRRVMNGHTGKLLPGEKAVLFFLGEELMLLIAMIILLDWSNPARYFVQISATIAVGILAPIVQWLVNKIKGNVPGG